ncbi:hypothetical protein DSECCO2_433460 [anaerobic digester metagenome]
MNVTEVPTQTAPAGEAAMLTLTGTPGFTTILMALEMAGLPEAQVIFEVSEQVTTSPLFRLLLV